jgi:hypothetical protein
MPKTVRLRRVIASTPETVDGALLEREGTPAPFEDANLSGEIREDRDDHADVGRTGPSHHQSEGRVM